MHLDHVLERFAAHPHAAPLPRRKTSNSRRSHAPAPLACKGLPLPPSASPRLIERITSLAERAPEGSALMPVTILHRRLLPLLAGEAEVVAFNSKIARAVRDWGRRQGAEVRLALIPDTELWRGLHCHGLLIAPHRLARAARGFLREAAARHAGVDRLPPHAVRFECKRGPVSPSQAEGWMAYASKSLVAQGTTVASVRGAASPRRCVRSRRLNLPRFPALARPVIAPVVTVHAQRPLRLTGGHVAAVSKECHHMPANARQKPARHRLRGLRVTEVSLCTNGQNRGARLLIAKSSDGETIELEIAEVDAERQYVAGWASIIERDGEPVEDDEGDSIDLDTLRTAAADFMISSRRGAVRHGEATAVIWTESVIVDHDLQKAWGVDLGLVGWWVGGTITDADVWADVKSKKLRSLSLGGFSARDPIEKSRSAGRAQTLGQILRQRGHDPSVTVGKARPRQEARTVTTPADARALTMAGISLRGQEVMRETLAGRHGAPDAAALAQRVAAAEAVSKARPGDAIALARTALLERAASRATVAKAATPAAVPRSAVEATRAILASRRGG